MTEIIAEIMVCDDCAMAHANGYSPEEWGRIPDPEPWAELPWADVALNCPEDGDCPFSWQHCPACGTTLGGTRHRMAVFAWDRREEH